MIDIISLIIYFGIIYLLAYLSNNQIISIIFILYLLSLFVVSFPFSLFFIIIYYIFN